MTVFRGDRGGAELALFLGCLPGGVAGDGPRLPGPGRLPGRASRGPGRLPGQGQLPEPAQLDRLG